MHDDRSHAAGFEDAFATLERELGSASKRARELQKQLDAGAKAARDGDVRRLARALESASAARADVEGHVARADAAGRYDFAQALRDGRFASEVERAAGTTLRGVRAVRDALMSFPVVVTFAPDELALVIGKKKTYKLRPSIVIGELAALRKRRPKANATFLDAVERAYVRVTDGEYHIAAPLAMIHEQLTPLPGQSAAYTVLDLVNDLYLLERGRLLETGSGKVLSFAASTGAKGDRAIRIATEDGDERVYSSIRFD